MNEPREFVVALRHDDGIVKILTGARSVTQAAAQVCAAERAPLRAVLSVTEVSE